MAGVDCVVREEAKREARAMGAPGRKLGKGWRQLKRGAAIQACIGCLLALPANCQPSNTEYRLKASYLMAIADFVQWPVTDEAKAANPQSALRLCVIGSYEFGAMLGQEASRAGNRSHRIEVRWVHNEKELKGCQIIFVSQSEIRNYGKILNATKGTPALTIGETDKFLDAGGIVELAFEKDTLKFKINLEAAHTSQLRLDARLLAMAHLVIREKSQAGI